MNKINYRYSKNFVVSIVVGLLLTQFEFETGVNLPIIRYLIYALSMYFLIKSVLINFNVSNYKGIVLKVAISILFLSVIISIIIAIPTLFSSEANFLSLKRVLSGQMLLFLFPLILLIEPNLFVLKIIFKLSFALSIIYLFITVPFLRYFISDLESGAEDFVRHFASGSMILLLMISYFSQKVKVITVLTFLVSLVLMVMHARRNQILYLSLILIFLLIIIYFTSSKQIKGNRITFTIGFIVITLFSIFFIYLYNLDFSYVIERLNTSSTEGINYNREYLFEEFEEDFNQTQIDWWIGRGFNGTFYSIMGGGKDAFGNNIAGQRDSIENGYYFLILKGGLLYLIPFVFLSILGFIKGFFYSKNILSKAASVIPLINLADMIGFGIPYLNLKTLILWFSLALCFSYKIRNYSDDRIKQILNF